ncbi:DNA methyltransferase, partial [Pseudomonas syringae]|uniref:DNA methyltransferase n=1 Tax=Pseudomonas syringae TaxID=317 RepID=UPI001A253E06
NISDEFYEISLESHQGWVEVWPVVSRKEGSSRVWRWGKPKAQEGLNKEIIGYKGESGEFRIVQKSRHTTKVIRSLLLDNEVSSRRGTGDFEKLFNGKIFSFPKSVELIRRFVEVGTGEDDIVLDFFSGSSTTAHAVMKVNAEDGGNRRFIMVQLPEECGQNTEAFKAGYNTIADIGKERIRRAGCKIKEGQHHSDWNKDIGFRVLKIDTSNMKEVYYTPDDISQSLLFDHVNNIREGRTSEDLLFQVLLDWGVDLALPISQQSIDGKTVFFVDCNALIACFDTGIDEEFVKQLAGHKPLRVVFCDAGFASDSVKINVEQVFNLLSPATEIKTL